VITAREHVPCPFCGLRCDDLRVGMDGAAVTVLANGCERSRTQFGLPLGPDAGCRVDGSAASLDQALARGAAILSAALQPLLLAGGADVQAVRALLELADRIGAVVDHINGDAMMRNLHVLQDTGWVTTTLSEVRNRADLLILVGGDIVSRFPRFFERCVDNASTLFAPARERPEVIFLGVPPPPGVSGQHVAVTPERLAELFASLRALQAGARLDAQQVAGLPVTELAALLARMRRARYGVIAWAAADLTMPHAELTLQSLCELVKALNQSGRFVGLPLAGNDGDVTAYQVITWQTGLPLRTRFARGGPQFDPYRFGAARLLQSAEVDALLYVAALDATRHPPPAACPTIVLGRAGMAPPPGCAVFIPIGTPGVDHAGHLYRGDTVVAVRMHKLVERGLPSAREALEQLGARIVRDGT
jgi:formylmethanofuran dehydrogenase subunit B